MRRSDREITDIEDKLGIIRRRKVLRLALAEQNQPYTAPLNFGFEYKDGILTLYMHGARGGKKVDILNRNKQVCFEMDGEHALIPGRKPACSVWGQILYSQAKSPSVSLGACSAGGFCAETQQTTRLFLTA
jgi:nitroimidazol reductase NimA-like FMN-containing flavoprotein (pyridoxamine 5'-phosphate oxidase superfamily)